MAGLGWIDREPVSEGRGGQRPEGVLEAVDVDDVDGVDGVVDVDDVDGVLEVAEVVDVDGVLGSGSEGGDSWIGGAARPPHSRPRHTPATSARPYDVMKAHLIIPAALVAIATVSASAAWACSCMRFDSAAQQLELADVLFVGQAMATQGGGKDRDRMGPGQAQTRFAVSRVVKGAPADQLNIRHTVGDGGAACGVEFAEGRTYTILASRQEDGTLSTNLCMMPQFPLADYETALRGMQGERG